MTNNHVVDIELHDTLTDPHRHLCTESNALLAELANVRKQTRIDIDALHRAARLLHSRHTMVSGSVEMAECDAACKTAGLNVRNWPLPKSVPKEYVSPLDAVEAALVEASNELNEIEDVKQLCGYQNLNHAIEAALQLTQEWKEETASKGPYI